MSGLISQVAETITITGAGIAAGYRNAHVVQVKVAGPSSEEFDAMFLVKLLCGLGSVSRCSIYHQHDKCGFEL